MYFTYLLLTSFSLQNYKMLMKARVVFVLPQPLGQCLAHTRRSKNIYWMSDSLRLSQFIFFKHFKKTYDVHVMSELSVHTDVSSLPGSWGGGEGVLA